MQILTCSVVAISLAFGVALHRAPQSETVALPPPIAPVTPVAESNYVESPHDASGARQLAASDLVRLHFVHVIVDPASDPALPLADPVGWCGACSSVVVEVEAGEDFFWGEYISEEAANAALDIEANRIAAFDAWIAELTAFWACPECPTAGACSKYLLWFGGQFGFAVMYDKLNNVWRIGILCMQPGVVVPCCTACTV